MYHPVRRKMRLSVCAILILLHNSLALPKIPETTEITHSTVTIDDNFENNIIDFDEEYSVRYNKKYGTVPWHSNDKITRENFRYTILDDDANMNYQSDESKRSKHNDTKTENKTNKIESNSETTPEPDYSVIPLEITQEPDFSVIPLELVSTTQNYLASIVDSTTEEDLSVIPLSTTVKTVPSVHISQTVTLPTSTQEYEFTTFNIDTTSNNKIETTTMIVQTTEKSIATEKSTTAKVEQIEVTTEESIASTTTKDVIIDKEISTTETTTIKTNTTAISNHTIVTEILNTNSSKQIENRTSIEVDSDEEKDVPVFTELDEESGEVPEDYYDSKDIVPTTAAPKTNPLTVLVGLAGSVVESVAERVVPKGLYDLFKRMQRQSEALESEKLRSREENGGLGQFGRGILKSISSGLSKPLSQLMAGVRDFGSLDSEPGLRRQLGLRSHQRRQCCQLPSGFVQG
ncbi:hypothetical protein evm_001851 [Chilo suppressalis]|nr:hypothetical protein evm_001851 [Chilo suppressalis]